MVARTVMQYHNAGVAGLHIEDQIQSKRCGHLSGKQVVSLDEFLMRIQAAVNARNAIPGGSDLVIIARTDSVQLLGMDEAIKRLKAAVAIGADAAFIEGVTTKEDLQRTVKALQPIPVNYQLHLIACFTSNGRAGPRKRYIRWSHATVHCTRSRSPRCQNNKFSFDASKTLRNRSPAHVYSFLVGFSGCCCSRYSRSDAVPQRDRHRSIISAGYGTA